MQEAAWALSNATSGGTADQIKYLVSINCIRPLCDLLTCSDVRIVTVALEGLENILKVRGKSQMQCCNTNVDADLYYQFPTKHGTASKVYKTHAALKY